MNTMKLDILMTSMWLAAGGITVKNRKEPLLLDLFYSVPLNGLK